MNSKGSESISQEMLIQQNQALSQELERLKADYHLVWRLLIETNRRLQVSSASIKAAVSSLLNYDIFWDGANQHEFLETINSSIDDVNGLVNLLALDFRAEAGELELKREPHSLQEIISTVPAVFNREGSAASLDIILPQSGKLVLVDYAYLTVALELLLEIIEASKTSPHIQIQAEEESNQWVVTLSGLDPRLAQGIYDMHFCRSGVSAGEILSPENVLKLHTACQILRSQEIGAEVISNQDGKGVVRLLVPAKGN